MSRRARKPSTSATASAATASATGTGGPAARCTVTVCRGCCCGTAKIPGLDHAAQLAGLRTALADTATVRPVPCLDACEHGNVVVVQPSPAGRAAGGRPVWLGLVNDLDATADIAAWTVAGGPGLAEIPDILDLYVFSPSRRIRQQFET